MRAGRSSLKLFACGMSDLGVEAISEDILCPANWIAERRHCFLEANFTATDDPDRSW
jgi:hypothetical protein